MPPVCRVIPDVPALDRVFEYLVPDALRAQVVIGAVVRVPLHGRRVRGWVEATEVTPETEPLRLLPVHAVVSAGPPADLVELCRWAAWRWGGPLASLLRAASPPRRVAPGSAPEVEVGVYPASAAPYPLPPGHRRVLRWPPGTPRDELVRALVDPEGSTIVIAPDAAADARLVGALEAQGRRVLVVRSDRSAAARTEAWAEARRGACVVVGGRTACFAPVPDLAAVVVLDDAAESLKEERTPAWHARDIGAERAARCGSRFDVVSPMPTAEALALAGSVGAPAPSDERAGWARTEVVDLRDESPGTTLLSESLALALRRTTDHGGRALCVVNRRGRVRVLACRTCRELARCGRCGAAVGESGDGFTCPRCGETRARVCLACTGATFRELRPGIGRIREHLAALLPRRDVLAVDAGSAPLPAFDVAVGTEAVLHRVRPDAIRPVALVAFLDLDQEVLAARYRAAEQALWLLVRAARLLGPRRDGGTLLLQTRLPTDPVVEAARQGDPGPVVARERERRALLRFPPYGGLAELSGDLGAVQAACDALRRQLEVIGPTGSHALVRSDSTTTLCDALRSADLSTARALGRLRIDVDPLRV